MSLLPPYRLLTGLDLFAQFEHHARRHRMALRPPGYGDAVVRLSLGDNEEVGGAVRGGGVRWLFFPDTTVTVGATTLVKDGKLVKSPTGTR